MYQTDIIIITILIYIHLGENNVEWALLNGLSVARQVDLFRNSTIIIAPHGAGLTNMIWARPGINLMTISSIEKEHNNYHHN